MNIEAVEAFITEKLQKNLSPTLYYHSLRHTLDVVQVVERLCISENISDKKDIILLKTAAWYHDVGFISTYRGHEEEGCRIARESLPHFDYSSNEIQSICEMIMATHMPQSPHNLFEKILCDADLDYLGRDDFDTISESLFQELTERLLIKDRSVWNKIQVNFLESHHYWTASNKALRNEKKLENLEKVKKSMI